jgi:iduronate 2-sulfatase
MPDFQSARWAVEQLGKQHDKPFLLCVGFIRPHVPWFVPSKWFDMHPLKDIVLPAHREDDLDDPPAIARRFAELPMMPTCR